MSWHIDAESTLSRSMSNVASLSYSCNFIRHTFASRLSISVGSWIVVSLLSSSLWGEHNSQIEMLTHIGSLEAVSWWYWHVTCVEGILAARDGALGRRDFGIDLARTADARILAGLHVSRLNVIRLNLLMYSTQSVIRSYDGGGGTGHHCLPWLECE